MMPPLMSLRELISPPMAALLRQAFRESRRVVLYFAALLTAGAFTSLRFLLLSRLLQAGLDGDFIAIAWELAALIGVWFLGQAAEYGATSVSLLFERSVGVEVVRKKVESLLSGSPDNVQSLDAHQIVHLLRNGLMVVARTLRSALGAVQRLVSAIMTAGAALILQPECGIVVLVAAVGVLLWTARLIGRQRQGASAALQGQQELHNRLCRLFAALPQIKLYGAGEAQLDRLAEPIGKQLGGEEASLRAQRLGTLETHVASAITGLLLLALGGWLLTLGRTTLADLAALLALHQSLFLGLRQVLQQWSLAEENSEYLSQLLDQANSVPAEASGTPEVKSTGKLLGEPIREIACREVASAVGDLVLVRDVTCQLSVGLLYGVAGPSGSGKSRLLHLLSGSSRPQSGLLTYNGFKVEDLDPGDLRSRIMLSAWPPLIVQGTLLENLKIAKPDASAELIEQALRQAALDKDVEQLRPVGGLEARVGRKGVQLSVGQLQRLALARAFLRNPEVLLLDDLLTGLDPETSRRVLESLKEWSRQRLVIFVLPGEMALDFCDEVLIVRSGRFVAQTSPEEAQGHDDLFRLARPAA
ncbi:MAG: ABC transporter ATP-binding protein/permease [Gemmatales bacterium]|nr:ABC transporter ATP-binding protein/permease [Gemmatales bacterium]MDW8385519.1 ABC transporter ATP-binding protein [Gemmatales bacterium]